MALSCQRGQEGEVCQTSPLSALTLQDQEERDRLGEIGLPYDSLIVQNPLCHQNQAIKVNQRKIKIRPTKSWLTTTSSSGIVEVLRVIEKTKNCLYLNILLLLYVCKKPCLNEIKYKHLNIIQHIIKIVSTDMVESVFLSKTTSFIAKFNFKLTHKPLQFVQPSIIKHILWLRYMFLPVKLNELAFDRMIKSISSLFDIRRF